MRWDKNIQAFFELVKAGLFPEREVQEFKSSMVQGVQEFKDVDWGEVQRLAEEQSVVGLVAAGIERVQEFKGSRVQGVQASTGSATGSRFKVPKPVTLQFIGQTLQLEERNKSMNEYLAWLIERLREEDIYAILVKGQGIAQCYERPLWRASGDIDLLLSEVNYEKAKKVLVPLAIDVEREFVALKHLGMTMPGGIVVELHGMMHSRLSKRVDRVIDEAQKRVFFGGNVRSWVVQGSRGSKVQGVQVFLPAPNEDVIFVFTHILHHYYIEGVGLRQICDWCRLLWTYRDALDYGLLEKWIREAGLMSEWKAFAALAVQYLGMPEEAMPLYSSDKKWSRKALRILGFVVESGNFGHNRAAATGKLHSVWLKTKDFARHSLVFPWDSIKFFFHFIGNGIEIAAQK